MGNVGGTGNSFILTHQRTAGSNAAGEIIEDPEEWCLAFSERDEVFDMLTTFLNERNEQEKNEIYEIMQCDAQGSCFDSKAALQSFMARQSEEDYQRIKDSLFTRFGQN